MVFPALVLSFLVIIFFSSRLEQHFPLDWIVHHSIVCRLFLLLDREHGILSDLGSGVSRGVCVL